MPEGSGLEGMNDEVSIVWTRLGVTVWTAEAEDAGNISAPNATTTTPHSRLVLADDPRRARFVQSARCRPPLPNDLSIRCSPSLSCNRSQGPSANPSILGDLARLAE